MQKYGLVKTLKDGDHEIKLVGNAFTFILYKSYFGKDLLNDIVTFAQKNSEAVKLDPNDITLENLGGISFDTEFILNLIAALMATAQYPNKPDIGELIMGIPPHFLTEPQIISDVLEFLSLFVASKKPQGNSRK
ncbi:MAG: hypothetical protein FWE03_00365 [Firmicutes bacterium]|nr:hypothetical protein [Bacillota bacterium]